MNRGRIGPFLLALFFFSLSGLSKELASPERSDAPKTAEKKDTKEKKTAGLNVLPVIDYTPETSWAFGAAGLWYFQISKDKSVDRPSNGSAKATYTLRKQFSMEINPDLYFRGGYHLLGLLNYSEYPSKFWGIGNKTSPSMEEGYTSRYRRFSLQSLKKVYRALNLGFQYLYDDTAIIKVQEGGELASRTVPGSNGGTVSGLGYLMTWDSRDNIFFPTKGSFHQFSVTSFGRALGSDFAFSQFNFDLRGYCRISTAHTLALQARFVFETGNPPFWAMALLGGDSIMRGYYRGRYRDRNMICWQVDYRWMPLFWRIGVNGFLGFGDVARRIEHFKLGDFKYSYGFGLRYILNRDQHFNVRLDFGFGKGTSGVYLTGGEAF